MKVLVTGATGFIGGHLVEDLHNRGYDVIAMARKTSNISKLKELGLEIRFADLTDPASLVEATKGVEAVIHLAAYYTFHGEKELYWKVNVEGTRSLVEACLKNGVTRFIYCSTTEAVGPVKNPPATEDVEPNPTYEYGRSKLAAERIVKSYGEKGLKYTILRPSGVYGPGNVNDVSYWFITGFAKKALWSYFIVGSGETLIQFVHVKDVVQGFRLALEKEVSIGQTYFITEDRAYTYNEVYKILAEIVGRDPPKIHVPPILAKLMIFPVEVTYKIFGKENFMWHVSTVDAVTQHRAYSIEKAKRELGYNPQYDLRRGLKETVEWYKQHGYI